MVFFILPFGNHVKKIGSNFSQGFSFLSKLNLKGLQTTTTTFIYRINVQHRKDCSANSIASLGGNTRTN